MSWSATGKKKADVFDHLGELGLAGATIRELLRTAPDKEPTKFGGLKLIKAATRLMSGVSLISSPWIEIVQFWSTAFETALPEQEQEGIRASLMPRWTSYSLEGMEAEEEPLEEPPAVPEATEELGALEKVLTDQIAHDEGRIAAMRQSLEDSQLANLELENAAQLAKTRREEEARVLADNRAWINELHKKAEDRSAIAVALHAELDKAEAYRTKLLAEASGVITPAQQTKSSPFPPIGFRQTLANVTFTGMEDQAAKRLRSEERYHGGNEALLLAALSGGRKTPESTNTRSDGLNFLPSFPFHFYVHIPVL